MFCSNCGTENKKDTKFCVNCGKELKKETKKEVVNNTNNKDESLGTASMVIGIISLILTFLINLLTLPLSITGLVLGIVNKAKGGKKVSGIVLNAISIGLSFMVFFFIMILGFSFIGQVFDRVFNSPYVKEEINELYDDLKDDYYDYDDDYKDDEEDLAKEAVLGKYNCKSFDGTGPNGDYIVRLELNKNNSFLWGKYGDTYKNYVKGTYDVDDLDKTNYSGNYTYYEVELDGDEFYQDGIEQDEPYESTYEFGITKENGKKQGIIMNTKTQNMYYCYEE